MVEFRGYITGAAKKRFMQKSRNMALGILLFALFAILPTIIIIGVRIHSWQMIVGYCSMFVILPVAAFIPQGKKAELAITPKRIYIQEDHIICVTDKFTDARMIYDIKKVIDHGEFYELNFPVGKMSDKFICQKSLVHGGSLREFEAILEKNRIKIEKKTD